MPNSVFKEEPAKETGRDNLFLWTVFLLLLAALVFACWLGSFYVFGHPEQPRAYRILQRLGKLAPPVRFVITKAPPGEFLEAQRVFERYSKYTALQMQRENELLFRCYLKNYTETKKTVPYLTGKFVILRAYELQRGDLLSSGVVVLTQSADFPQLLAEIVYPAPRESVSDILALLQPGLELRLQRTLDLSAVVQVSHAPEGRLQVSVFPLLYGSYALKNGVGSFSLEPPASVNVGAGFPLVRGEEVRSVMRENLRRRAIAKGAQPGQPEPAGEIVRLEETPSPAGNKPGSSGAESVASGSSAVLPPEGAPSPLPAEPVARAEPVGSKSEPAGKAEPVVKAEPVAKAEPVVKAEPAAKTETVKNGNPAWMSRLGQNLAQPNSAALGVKPAGEASAVGAAGGAPGVKTAKTAPGSGGGAPTPGGHEKETAAGSVASTKAAPAIQLASNTAGGASAAGKLSKSDPSRDGERHPPEPAKVGTKPVPTATASGQGATAQPATGAVAGKPFLAASPVPSTTQATGSWKTYGGGKSPGGKSVTAEQATSLQGRNDGSPIYLHGRFTVTAAGTNRAVLRQSSGGDGKGQPRVIVEYPAGAVPPQQGASVAREDGRGFEIREVRRTPDGQVNIYVREVSAP